MPEKLYIYMRLLNLSALLSHRGEAAKTVKQNILLQQERSSTAEEALPTHRQIQASATITY